MCFMFAACPPDPEPELLQISESVLKANKWVNRDVSDWNDTSYGGYYETSSDVYYFMDNNIGYNYQQFTDHDTSLGTNKTTYFEKFTYSITDNTVTIRFTDTGSTMRFTYTAAGYLTRNSSFYEPLKMTSSDYSFVNQNAENMEYEDNLEDYVQVTDEFNLEELAIEITVKSQLAQKYPNEYFKYGVEYGYDWYINSAYFTMSGSTGKVTVVMDEKYNMISYKKLRDKEASGSTLTSVEKTLMKDCKKIIEDAVKKFMVRVFVEANGEKYYVEENIRPGYVNLDTDYKPNVDENGNEDEEENDDISGTISGHAYVDLGLSVKWATCNVGASKPEDYGDYYAWGETTTKSDYSWKTYKWCKGTDDTMTKYCTDSDYGTVDNRTTLTSSDDVATVKWGSKWRMPTKEEMKELDEDCTWTWTTQNGVRGMKVKGPNGNSIFLPAAGYRYGTDLNGRGSDGHYWSATLNENSSDDAYYLFFNDGYYYWVSWFFRYYGHTVRPVTE